jgi:hypothetical protein
MTEAQGNGSSRCTRCGVRITWAPVERDGNIYCCENCALGSPCLCARLQADRFNDRGGGRGKIVKEEYEAEKGELS